MGIRVPLITGAPPIIVGVDVMYFICIAELLYQITAYLQSTFFLHDLCIYLSPSRSHCRKYLSSFLLGFSHGVRVEWYVWCCICGHMVGMVVCFLLAVKLVLSVGWYER